LRKLHNEELNDLYSSPSNIRVINSRGRWVNSRSRWAGHVARIGEKSGVYRFLVGKTEGKGPLESPRLRWEDNISGMWEYGLDPAGSG
jgi:hypothetical protein